MKRANNLYEDICSYDTALNAHFKARHNKRYRAEVLRFERKRETNLLNLMYELKNKTYHLGEYRTFKIYEPKERIVMALPYRDRVVQHMIVRYIEPIFEKHMYAHSYACRKGKGTLAASDYLLRILYKEEVINGKSLYALKCDVHHYFQSIDCETLKKILRKYIKDKDLLIILDRIIDHNGIFPDGVGIPVGNLTSQLFANLYLTELDNFIMNVLGVKDYVRYMDDFILLSPDKKFLRECEERIRTFLREQLKLELNPKTEIVYAKNGVDFVGYVHFNMTRKVRKGAIRRMNKLLKKYEKALIGTEWFDSSFQSRVGCMQHADSFYLIKQFEEEAERIRELRKKNELADSSRTTGIAS